MKTVRLFLCSAAGLLLATAAAKIASSLGHSRILLERDPVTAFLFRDLFRLVSVVEIVIAAVCLFSRRIWFSAGLLAWLATGFLIYRLVLLSAGYRRPCPCLGNLTDMLHISPQTADTAMKIILGYMLLGAYATLFWLWRGNRKLSMVVSTSTAAGKSVS